MAWVALIQSSEFKVCSSLQQQQTDFIIQSPCRPPAKGASPAGRSAKKPRVRGQPDHNAAHSQQRNTPKIRTVHMASQTFPRGPTEQESMNETANID
jgi:hypothetical protein